MHTARVKNGNESVRYDYYPDTCPVCRHAAHIEHISKNNGHLFPTEGDKAESKLQLLFECPRHTCGTLFIIEYVKAYIMDVGYIYRASSFHPMSHKKFDVLEGIDAISPRFREIANQAAKAESDGLDQIAGMGYRKALEFLIKDYCIKLQPDKETEIKKQLLGACIQNFVLDQNIKNCASRAAWLGNDETHYERVWTDHDVKDLKILIRLTQNWISNERLTAQYLEDLKPKKKTNQ